LAARGVISAVAFEELAVEDVGAARTAGRRRRVEARMVGAYILEMVSCGTFGKFRCCELKGA
jgi:hypothetical protein